MLLRILFAAAIVLAFGAALVGPFVFDDFGLLNDPAIASPSGWWQCWRWEQTRPFTWFSFWITYELGDESPLVYHLISLALHVAVTALVWDVLRRVLPERAAVIATSIFAIHPLVVEPVSYIYARGSLWAALFSLLALRSWIADRVGLAAICFLLGMLAKEECAAIPVFLVLFDFSRGYLSRGGRARRSPLAAMFGIAVLLGIRTVWAAAHVPGSQAGAQAGISPLKYLAAQGPEILGYIRKLLLPWGFSIDYSSTPPLSSGAIAAWLVVAAMAAFAALRFHKLEAGFWFIAGLALLVPSSSIFPAADLANDRRMYLPLIAFSACAGLLLKRADIRFLGAAAAVLIIIDIHYSSLWRSPEALWTQAMAAAPEKVRPRLQLARVTSPERGLELLREAQQLAPANADVAVEQGRIILESQRPAEALAAFGRALALDPHDARVINDRGAALAALGQRDAARADFKRAITIDSCLFDARLNLLRMGEQTTPAQGCRYTEKEQEALKKARP